LGCIRTRTSGNIYNLAYYILLRCSVQFISQEGTTHTVAGGCILISIIIIIRTRSALADTAYGNMVARLPAGRRGGDRVTCLAAECLTYFFFFPSPTGWWFIFVPEALFSISERRVMAKGCGFIFYQLKKERNLFLRHIMRIIHMHYRIG